MWRDVFSGLTLAAITGALYALGMNFAPVELEPRRRCLGSSRAVDSILSVSGVARRPVG